MARVVLDHVTKIFQEGKRKVVAVDDVCLNIADGEFFVLLGPSGCGKTTILRIIAGLEKPTRGRVYIDDVDVTDLPPKDRDVAMVFQNYALYPHMTVFENIAFPLKLRKLPKAEIERRVREIARLLKIEDLLDRYPRQLSGGQQQRVALARALVRQPKVWLLDEPLSNLDALLRVHMRAEIKRLQKELKVTTIYVTHDQVEAMTMADRIAVMNQGKVIQVGTPYEIYHKPRHMFVAGFVGQPPMNFLKCEVKQLENTVQLIGETFRLTLPPELGKILIERGVSEVYLGFRPEHAQLTGVNDENIIVGEVYVIEPLGSEYIINIRVGDTIVKVRQQTLPPNIAVGDKVGIKISPEKIYVFDVKTGEAII